MTFTFDPEEYGPIAQALIQKASLCELGPGLPDSEVRADLESLTPSGVLNGQVPVDVNMAHCCVSGLWLLHNYLDESHHISQSIGTQSGSYWHGIMHRREPDFSNAKYWFRRVGDHPIFPELYLAATELLTAEGKTEPIEGLLAGQHWDAYKFVDACEAAVHGRSQHGATCQEIQALEWQLLFDFCYRHAVGA